MDRPPRWKIYTGDCREVLRQCPDDYFHSVVTDPPYSIGFMEMWDKTGIPYDVAMWREVLRTMRPGAHAVVFGAPRTFHRMVCAVENAGFEIRDQLVWLSGHKMPKGRDISKALDKRAGAERKVVGRYQPPGMDRPWGLKNASDERQVELFTSSRNNLDITAAATPEAAKWEGWNTGLRPAIEPICLARKPLSEKTVEDNILRWSAGGLNIDACRIAYRSDEDKKSASPQGRCTSKSKNPPEPDAGRRLPRKEFVRPEQRGRWPATALFDERAARMLDEQSGALKSGGTVSGNEPSLPAEGPCYGEFKSRLPFASYGDSGGASRFFYVARASPNERTCGGAIENPHVAVKPLALMQWLTKLVTPPGGVLLDPFCGSGSTGMAAMLEGFYFRGIDLEPEYVQIAEERIRYVEVHGQVT